jgi:hypothetical protein
MKISEAMNRTSQQDHNGGGKCVYGHHVDIRVIVRVEVADAQNRD